MSAGPRGATRPAEPGDDAPLALIDSRSWPAELQVVPPNAADQPFFGPRRATRDVVVAVVDGQPAGYAHLARHIPIEKNAHVLHLNALVVDERHRGRGLGHLLVDAAIAQARERGARKLGLRAMSTNVRAIGLYRQHGFVLEGRLVQEFRQADGSYVDELWFALPLG